MTTIRVVSLAGWRRHWRVALAAALTAGLVMGQGPGVASPVATAAVLARVPTDQRLVALTFDDGPSLVNTPRILALLRRFHMHATFFVLGQEAERFPQLVREEVRQGDEVGNHTYAHVNLAHHGPRRIEQELARTQAVLQAIAGVTPTLMRPPCGAYNAQVVAVAQRLRLRVVLWSPDQDPRDWANPPADRMVSQVLEHLRPGDIILFHDGAGSRHTVAALAVLLRDLEAGGWRSVTVSDLLRAARPPAPGDRSGEAAQANMLY
jgi:peptidoglycan/xylan/chitin deacetylase (PgdA/CDA1 family)